MLNRIILIGRLTRDPELRYTPSGTPVAKFTLAVDRPFLDKQGNRGTDFINVVAWRKLGELCAQYLGKGRLAAVEGRLEIRAYDDKDGNRRWMTEVIADNVRFLDGAKGSGGQDAQGSQGSPNSRDAQDSPGSRGEGQSYRDEIDFSDDDEPLPF
jgi:single-strand DNA-binding protein